MPSCVIIGCTNNTGRKPEHVIMHRFPRTRYFIITWLKACGVSDEEIETFAEQILKDQRGSKYRICSDHFTKDQYVTTSTKGGKKIRLQFDAVPSIDFSRSSTFCPVPSTEFSRMPSCFVSSCRSANKPEGTILHCFPKKKETVIVWLRSCGVDEEEMDSCVAQVMGDKRGDKFRICSQHFSDDQYESTIGQARPSRRRLIFGAVPNKNFGAPASYAPAAFIFMKILAARTNPDNVILSTDTALTIADTANPVQMTTKMLPTGSCTEFFGTPSVEDMITEKKKILVHQCTQTDFPPQKVDQGTDPECTWTDLISQMLVLSKEKLIMKDQFIQWPEFEFNFVGEILKVSRDHNYSQKKKDIVEPAELPVTVQALTLPALVKPPKPKLEPELVWTDFEESDDDDQPLLTEKRVEDPDYCPSVEDYSTDTDEEDKSSVSYCTTDEECVTSMLEEQQEVPAGECLMPVLLDDNYISVAQEEDPEHWQHVNQVVPSQESARLPECHGPDSTVLKEEIMAIKTETEEATNGEYPQISVVVDGGRVLVVGKEIVMKTVGEEVCEAQEDSPVTSGLGGSYAQSLSTEILMKTVGEGVCVTQEDSPVTGVLGELCPRSLSTVESSSIKTEEAENVNEDKMDEDVGDIAKGISIDAIRGYESASVKQEVPDVTDLQRVLPIEAERRHKRLFSPSPSDSDICEIPARKCSRYRKSGTKINESLGNMSVSCDHEEGEEILPVAQDLRTPIEVTRVGSFFNMESGTPYKCTNCGITFTCHEPQIILRSFRGTEGQPSCPNCEKKCCEKVARVVDHTCSQCEENFQTNEELTTHLATTWHNPFWCVACERGFKNKNGLRLHKYCVHSSTKRVKCKECGKCFDSKQSLEVHRRYHKNYSGVKYEKLLKAQTPCKNYYQCSECSQNFKSAYHFFTHERSHTGERPFKCKKCRKGFKLKSALLRHLLIHGIGKPFQCDVCEKGFTKHSYYARHVELHKETNPSCAVCGETFSTSLCLQRHERDKHSVEPVHKCGECGKEFRLMYYFLKHHKIHLQEGTT